MGDTADTSLQEMSASEMIDYGWLFARRRYKLILSTFAFALGISIIYILLTPSIFTARAKLLIEGPRISSVEQASNIGDVRVDAGQLESEIQIVTSEKVAEAVFNKLHLDADPEFTGTARWAIGSVLDSVAWKASPSTAANVNERMRRGVYLLIKNLEVDRVGVSDVLDIRYSSTSPEKSARIANAIADTFVAQELDARDQSFAQTGAWLKERSTELRLQAEAAEQAVVQFKRDNNIVSLGGSLLSDQQITELNSQFSKARQITSEAKAKMERVQSIIGAMSTIGNVDEILGSELEDPVFQKLRQQYVDMFNRQKALIVQHGENFLEVKTLQIQLDILKSSITQEVIQVGKDTTAEYDAQKQRQNDLETDLDKSILQSHETGQMDVKLKELQDTAKSYRAVYDNYLQRFTESEQAGSIPFFRARVIVPAEPPLEKSRPKLLLTLVLGAFGGLSMGIALGFFRDLTARGLRTHRDVEVQLRLPCVAIIPKIERLPRSKRRYSLLEARGNQDQIDAAKPDKLRKIERGDHAFWMVSKKPLSRFTEFCPVNEVGDRPKVYGFESW